MARKTYGRTGWLFKDSSKNRSHLGKFRNRIKVPTSTDTPRARILAETKLGGLGSTVLWRDHAQYYYTESGRRIPRKTAPQTRIIAKESEHFQHRIVFPEYQHLKEDDKPPLIQLIEKKVRTQNVVSNDRRTYHINWNWMPVIDQAYYSLICFLAGDRAFFVENDRINMMLRLSRDYASTRARELVQREQWDRIVWVEVMRNRT